MDDHTQPRLQMVWPYRRLATPPAVEPPPGYMVRTYRRGDEPGFFQVMELAGWPGWDYEKLQPRIAKIPPGGWFMAIHKESGQIVATAMAVHSHTEQHPFGAALGWVAGDPAHSGRGLGRLVCAAATRRLIDAGYRNIHLYTEDWRLPALKTYLKSPFLTCRRCPSDGGRSASNCAGHLRPRPGCGPAPLHVQVRPRTHGATSIHA
jgi:mycothiol synthase